jgi:putative endopeptidase
MNRRAFLTLSTTAIGASLAPNLGWATPTGRPVLGTFGFDMAGRDLTIRPGNDFFRYGGGTWMKNNQIPADRSRWGAFDALGAKAEADVRAIIDELSAKTAAPGTIEQKIGDFYRSYMDIAAIEAAGMTPLKGELDLIAAATTHNDIAALFGKPDLPTPSPIGWGVGLDDGNPDRYIVTISHGGLGLPEREFYLKDDARFKDLREKYPVHIAKMLTLAGQSDATAKAATIMALETEIAKLHWINTDRRNSTKTYNLKKRSELETIAPDFPWAAGLGASGFNNVTDCVVSELSAMAPLATLFKNTPVETWKTYLSYHLIASSASMLPKALDDERFEFFGKTLSGQRQQRDRWKRGTQAINGALGEGIGWNWLKTCAKRFQCALTA